MRYLLFVVVVFVSTSSSVRAQKKCHVCNAPTWSNCTNETPWCDRGPTQCFSGYGAYWDASTESFQYKFLKGCLDCANTTIGCINLKKKMITDFNLNLTECHLSCCEENNCNTMEPMPPQPESTSPLIVLHKGLVALSLSFMFFSYSL